MNYKKIYSSVYAEGSNLFENQYKYNVQEKTKLYPLYKTSKAQEEARKADIRKTIIFNGKIDENEVEQLYKQTYRDENLKNVANWKSLIGDKLLQAFSKNNLNKTDITQKMIDNIYLNIPKYKSDVKTKGNKEQIMSIKVLVNDTLNEKLYGPNFREAEKIRAVMKGKLARKELTMMRENIDAKNAMIEDDAVNIQSAIRGAISRKKVTIMKEREKEIDKGTNEVIDDILDSVIDATKRKRMKLRDTPEIKSYTADHKDYLVSKNKKIVADAVNIQSAIRGAISRKRVKTGHIIKQADLEKQGELSEITTKAQPGKTNPYIEYNKYKELDNVQPYIITHKAFKENIKHNVHGAQSARNLMYYIEQNEDKALKYIKDNSQYIPAYIQNIKDLDQLKKAIRKNIFIDKSISVVLKSGKVDKSEGVQTRGMASSSKPKTRSTTQTN